MKIVFDTNALISRLHLLDVECERVIPYIVLSELDRLKMGNTELAANARAAVRKLMDIEVTYDSEFSNQHPSYQSKIYNADDLIIECARAHDAVLVSGDYLATLKAKSRGIPVYDEDEHEDDYQGFKELKLDDYSIAHFYQEPENNKYGLLQNEYVIVKNLQGHVVDAFKWDGEKHVHIQDKNMNTVALGKFKCLDIYQRCAMDSLFSNEATLLRGKAGSGKSLLAFTFAMNGLEKGKFSKLVCFVNPVPVRGAQEIGFYKGDKNEKLLQSGIGNLLISKLGDIGQVNALIGSGRLVLLPLVDIRGYDTGEDSLVWITEAQNTNVDLMKLSLQRIAKGSKIIIDGDDKAQVDKEVFGGANNGIKRLSRVFRGEKVYGEMQFNKIYRSEIAAIADRM